MLFNWLLFGVFIIVLFCVGFRARRHVDTSNEGGFLLGGKSLGAVVGAATIVATGFSGWAFIGSPGVAYQFGTIELLGNFLFAPAMVISVLVFGNYLRRRASRLHSLTVPEYIANQHADGILGRVIQGTAAIVTIILLLVFMIGQVKALGLLASPMLGISVNSCAALLMFIIICYTMLGGMLAVAWSDAIMVIFMAISAVYICITIFLETNLTEILSLLREIDNELVSPTSAEPYAKKPFSIFLYFPYAFIFTLCLPYMSNRIFALKEDVNIIKLVSYIALLTCLLSITPFTGLYARARLAPLDEPDQAMVMVINSLLDPAVSALITLGILFAIKSTVNSLLHTVSSAASYDLRKALIPNKHFSAEKLLTINRMTVLLFGAIALIILLFVPPFMLVWLGILGAGTLMASFTGPILISSVWLGNVYGAFSAIVGGFIISSVLLLYFDGRWLVAPLYGCLVSAILYCVVSQLTFKAQPRKVL